MNIFIFSFPGEEKKKKDPLATKKSVRVFFFAPPVHSTPSRLRLQLPPPSDTQTRRSWSPIRPQSEPPNCPPWTLAHTGRPWWYFRPTTAFWASGIVHRDLIFHFLQRKAGGKILINKSHYAFSRRDARNLDLVLPLPLLHTVARGL